MRAVIKQVLKGHSDIEVVGEAGDPYEAREAIKALTPDVITLDVEMPRMSGIEFLEKIMRLRPMPVIMISTLTAKGADLAIEAMSLGAIDCIGKPASGEYFEAFKDLPDMLRAAANVPVSALAKRTAAKPVESEFMSGNNVVAIGASTGGVDALMNIISRMPAMCAPTVITQHMPAGFTTSFAARLDANCAARVAEATEGAPLRPGHIYLAPGGPRHLVVAGRHQKTCSLVDGPPVNGHCPSVDVLFESVAPLPDGVIGVLLTGMGRDGATGLKAIRENGGRTIGQDRASSVVYGMPRVAHEEGAVETQLPLSKITDEILNLSRRAPG